MNKNPVNLCGVFSINGGKWDFKKYKLMKGATHETYIFSLLYVNPNPILSLNPRLNTEVKAV